MYNKTSITRAIRSRFTDAQVAAFIRLFKISPASAQSQRLVSAEDAITAGLVFVDREGNILSQIPANVYSSANEFYGANTRLFNETFYKSFSTVRDASPYVLLFDQIMHYFTTYGAEAMGIKLPTYVPVQALELPETQYNQNFKITVIQIVPDEDCIERLNGYLKSLTAPSSDIMRHVTEILPLTTIRTDDIKSFEVQVVKHKMDDTVPSAPVSQLRYIVYAITGETLIIKNKAMREAIKHRASISGDMAYDLFCKCDIAGLASIFLRYKPIFLAFKSHNKCAPFINFLRRKADIYHKPLSNESLQNFTSITSLTARANIIAKASNRELVKLLNSIISRMNVTEPVPGVYSIRNGRTFVKENGLTFSNDLQYHREAVSKALIDRLTPVLSGKAFCLPDYIDYAIPTTEKQFVGNIPYGSRILKSSADAFAIGVHWFNQKHERVDIDLHMNSATSHFGWNSAYRDGAAEVIYTGDQTNAPEPNGAAEAYWFNPKDDAYIVTANLYSGPQDTEFKLFMTEKKPTQASYGRSHWDTQNHQYTYDPNESLFPAIPLRFEKDNSAMTIGMFHNDAFFFYGGTLSNGIVPTANYAQFIEGLSAQLHSKTMLSDLLNACGAIILEPVDMAEMTTEQLSSVISLAPEDLTVDTLLNIIDGDI